MNTEAIRIWREGPHTMGAIWGPNFMEGEVEYAEVRAPFGRVEQYFAAIDAVRKLEKRLNIARRHLPLWWSTAEAEHPRVVDHHPRVELEEADPADWWKGKGNDE
jgi:hypothetical protein